MIQKLKDYVGGVKNYIPIDNLMINNRSKDWYSELGKYILDTLDIKKIPELKHYKDYFELRKSATLDIFNLFLKMKVKNPKLYFPVAYFFFSSALNEITLKKMFGEPLLHNDFGEGFLGEYNEESDEYDEPEIKALYASYFVDVNGLDFHIGYDHRGTDIEIMLPGVFVHRNVSDTLAQKCFDGLKTLVDLFQEE